MCDQCLTIGPPPGTTSGECYWTAGLMAGDGCFTMNGGSFVIALAMKDQRSVVRAATCMASLAANYKGRYPVASIKVHQQVHKKGGTFYRIWLGGPRAVNIAQELLPFLGDNDKADQLQAALTATASAQGG